MGISDPAYPKIVEIAGVLVDGGWREVAAFSLVIRPDGWVIPPEAAMVHGITTDIAVEIGVPLRTAISVFTNLRRASSEYGGHNVEFDDKMVEAALLSLGADPIAALDPRPRFCTADLGTPICRIPPTPKMVAAGFGPHKRPKLEELHRELFGRGFEGAHSALGDVRATLACLRTIRARAV
jgi:DNA polymerase-3 subunit epsilon